MLDSQHLSRTQLRTLLRRKRRALSPLEQRRAALYLYRQLAQHPLFRRAQRIAVYLANDGEIDPKLLVKAAQKRGKQVYLPQLRTWPKKHMVMQQLIPGEPLRRNRFGIAEPRPQRHRQKPIWALDVLLMPLVGFDEQGGRLGMGGGFYDRALAFRARRQHWRGPLLIGLAHECQKVQRLEQAHWDVPLDAVVSERRWYWVR